MPQFEYLIAVGSNLGDRLRFIESAMEVLKSEGVSILRVSNLVESAPIGAADKAFINGAFVCRSELKPEAMMTLLLNVEKQLGRTREIKWGNRTIDLDIIEIRDSDGRAIVVSSEFLTVPHPRMWDREFVMVPAREVWQFKTLSEHETLSSNWILAVLGLATLIRLVFSALIPFGNDEAYYWDWARVPLLSYFDHPPMVAWLAGIGAVIVPDNAVTLGGRFSVAVCYFVVCLLLLNLTRSLKGQELSRHESVCFLFATQGIPAFSLGGIMLLPDVGLILFSTLALQLILQWSGLERLTLKHGLAIGLSFGLAGLSKYHAAVIAGGTLGYLLFHRRRQFAGDLWFWISLVCVGLLCVSPVILWNARHDWVSFLFQGSRGLSGQGFAVTPALRTLLGELVFLGPFYVLGGYYAWKERTIYLGRVEFKFMLAASLPLILILKIFSFTSQTLPHWTMPSFWALLPVVILSLGKLSKTQYRFSVGYGVLFCFVVPLLLSSVTLRRGLLAALNNKPGGLGELTLWDEASRDQEFIGYIQDKSWQIGTSQLDCGTEPVYAAPRWFTVAQAAANLPWRPVVETLDTDHLSYYRFRPTRHVWTGCPTVVLSEKPHYLSVKESGLIQIVDEKEFEIRGHADRRILVARGYKNLEPTKN